MLFLTMGDPVRVKEVAVVVSLLQLGVEELLERGKVGNQEA